MHLGLLNITEITGDFGARFCEEILGIYCYTGEDCNCAFAGKGKVNPMKELEKNPKFQDSFAKLGDSWAIHDWIVEELDDFTCAMYGYTRVQSVDEVRALMLKKDVGEAESIINHSYNIDLAKLPPYKHSLVPHVQSIQG